MPLLRLLDLYIKSFIASVRGQRSLNLLILAVLDNQLLIRRLLHQLIKVIILLTRVRKGSIAARVSIPEESLKRLRIPLVCLRDKVEPPLVGELLFLLDVAQVEILAMVALRGHSTVARMLEVGHVAVDAHEAELCLLVRLCLKELAHAWHCIGGVPLP